MIRAVIFMMGYCTETGRNPALLRNFPDLGENLGEKNVNNKSHGSRMM